VAEPELAIRANPTEPGVNVIDEHRMTPRTRPTGRRAATRTGDMWVMAIDWLIHRNGLCYHHSLESAAVAIRSGRS
jgi:hypothetical protein